MTETIDGSDVAVALRDVHVSFDRAWHKPVWALRGMNLQVNRGEVLGLLGPNGCGKTTTISCILGLLEPKSGEVTCLGRAVNHMGGSRGRGQCGVLLEDTRLPPYLSVRDALRVVCKIRGIRARAEAAALEKVIQLCSIEPLLERRSVDLSKGQARRAGLAAALLGDPELLILDEPSAGLDVSARVEFDDLLRRIGDGKRTIIVASHLLSDIEATCSHVAIVSEGQLLAKEATPDLLRNGEGPQQSDIYLASEFTERLKALALEFESSRFPQEVKLKTTLSDLEVLQRLTSDALVPRRIEPKADLVSYYLKALGGQEQ